MDIRGFFGGSSKKSVVKESIVTKIVEVKETKSISAQKKNVNTIPKSPQVVNHISSPNLKQNVNNKESKKRFNIFY
jgi:hypothetical protein